MCQEDDWKMVAKRSMYVPFLGQPARQGRIGTAARVQLCKEQGARRLGFGDGGRGGGGASIHDHPWRPVAGRIGITCLGVGQIALRCNDQGSAGRLYLPFLGWPAAGRDTVTAMVQLRPERLHAGVKHRQRACGPPDGAALPRSLLLPRARHSSITVPDGTSARHWTLKRLRPGRPRCTHAEPPPATPTKHVCHTNAGASNAASALAA